MELSSINVACPPLFPPLHGYLECSRPIENSTVETTGRLKITNRPGSQCVLRCPTRLISFLTPLCLSKKIMMLRMFFPFIKSYRASGIFVKTCGEDGEWHGDDDGICISE